MGFAVSTLHTSLSPSSSPRASASYCGLPRNTSSMHRAAFSMRLRERRFPAGSACPASTNTELLYLVSAIHQQPTIYKTHFGRRFVRDQEKLPHLDSNQD